MSTKMFIFHPKKENAKPRALELSSKFDTFWHACLAQKNAVNPIFKPHFATKKVMKTKRKRKNYGRSIAKEDIQRLHYK